MRRAESGLIAFNRALARVLTAAISLFVYSLCVIESAHAQGVAPPATYAAVDENNVNLLTGELFTSTPSISVGVPGSGGLVYQRTYSSSAQGWRDNVTGTVNSSGATYIVTLMGVSEAFTLSGTAFTPSEGTGGTLTFASNVYRYTTASGAVALFDKGLASSQPTQANEGQVTQLTMPSGERLTFTYTELRTPALPDPPTFLSYRLQSVTNTLGYQLSFKYESNSPNATGINLIEVTAINNAVAYCDPTANGCGLSGWPRLAFGVDGTALTVTDSASRTWRYAVTSGLITGIRWPGSSSDNITISYSSGKVLQLSNGVGTWLYSAWSTTPARTDPLNHTQSFGITDGRVTSWIRPGGATTTYAYDTVGRLTRVTQPEGNNTRFTYDARGNVTEIREVAKTGSGLSDIVITATYPSDCTVSPITPVTCNQPISITDARGFRIEYTYDVTHGGVLTVTAPGSTGSAPIGTGVRPQERFTYEALYAYYKNSGGTIVAAPTPVYFLTETSACATASSCDGGSDETVTSIGYGSNGVANNRLPVTISLAAGDASLTATTTYAYDGVGNLLTRDGPLLTDADTTRYRYDGLRRVIGIVGPDPDSGGSLLFPAMRYTYNDLGLVTSVERGTVNSQSDGDWALFSSLRAQNFEYDSIGRRVRTSLAFGGSTYAVAQYSYDAANRLDCVAVRMNPSIFGSLPSSACSLGTEGSNGPDRITRMTYDVVDQLLQVTRGYGTSLAQATLTQTWTTNGRVATTADASSNLTTYEYDGFDRARKIRFPNTSGGGSSTTDYEQYTYDAGSHVTELRRRDASTITFVYDNLSRTKTMTPSTGAQVSYEYDNFSRLTQASFTGQTLTFGYDQLSRNTSAGGPLGTVSYQYDLAGRRTRLTWPDAIYAQYDYDLSSAVTAIRENGAMSGAGVLATYAYDNLGRRVSIARGNTVTTSYSYTGASLSTLAQDLDSTSQDQTLTFSYNAAGQAISRSGSNSAYAWSQPASGLTTNAANGLNQITSQNSASFSYDGRGNLTSTGAASYSYDIYNRLTGAGSATLSYDPLGRLYETVGGGATTRFQYSDGSLIAEYDGSSGALLHRFVPGPGLDEPVVSYEGSGTAPSDRRWLLQDQLGSVIAITNGSGVATNINSYDEYGVPGASNAGRFQYTGQPWITEASLYYYRARVYSPLLGRFLQSDPILYSGGMNLYAYVANDPQNLTDPSGTDSLHCNPYRWVTVRNTPSPDGVGTTSTVTVGPLVCDWSWGPDRPRPIDESGPVETLEAMIEINGGNVTVDFPTCPTDSRSSASASYGGTAFAGNTGGSANVTGTASVPQSSLRNGSIRGIQFGATLSFARLSGTGLFASYGPSYGVGESSGAEPTGYRETANETSQTGLGDGPGFEMSTTTGGSDSSFSSSISDRGAIGAYDAHGQQTNYNVYSRPLGCRN